MKFSLGWRAGSMLLGRCEGVGKGEAGVGGGGKGGRVLGHGFMNYEGPCRSDDTSTVRKATFTIKGGVHLLLQFLV